MKIIAVAAGVLAVTLLAYDTSVVVRALHRGRALAASSEPLSQRPEAATGALLVVGDSTAVGTGAARAEDSVAGRLASDFPRLRIDNLAVDGAVYAEVADQLTEAPRAQYDVVLVQAGGNDVLQFTGRAALGDAVDTVFDRARRRAPRVVVLATGDVGSAPAVPWPLDYLMTARSRQLREIVATRSAETARVHFVDLLDDDTREDPFAREPGRYYARDGLHPSASGYALWYRRLRDEVPLAEWLTSTSPDAADDASAASSSSTGPAM